MEITAINLICIAFVVCIPASAYFSFKRGIKTGIASSLAVLYSESYLTNAGINAIGRPYLDALTGQDVEE